MLTDTACLKAKHQDKPYKLTDGYGLYLMVTPSAKLWRMAYRFGGKQKTLSFGPYPAVKLAEARKKREAAKELLAQLIDPGALKQEEKRAREAQQSFGEWADAWLAKERLIWDQKTMDGKERHVTYLKKEFGGRLVPDIKRQDVLVFLKRFERIGTLETRDRVRSTGEKICIYADIDGTDYNPFRNLKMQLTRNKSTPRAALIDDNRVQKLFQDIAAPFDRARFNDLVGSALRFISLTVVRPGEIASAEWCDFDFIRNRWTISAEKMKMDKEHVVPLSRQALALLDEVRRHTGNRQWVFSCSRDQPISDNTLCKRLRDLGYDTSTEHCAHGFRTTFSTLCNGETDVEENKMWDGDMIELQLAHLDETSVKAIYNRTGPLSLIGARAKLLQHWADRIDSMVGNNVIPINNKKVTENADAATGRR